MCGGEKREGRFGFVTLRTRPPYLGTWGSGGCATETVFGLGFSSDEVIGRDNDKGCRRALDPCNVRQIVHP